MDKLEERCKEDLEGLGNRLYVRMCMCYKFVLYLTEAFGLMRNT